MEEERKGDMMLADYVETIYTTYVRAGRIIVAVSKDCQPAPPKYHDFGSAQAACAFLQGVKGSAEEGNRLVGAWIMS